ncbi:ATP-dependent DNA helicase PIF2-like [Brassica rapa]|uniref:ATP-dependent DNA helicase PIF2-like n=1 Tax=Brassica campestris TaxID=3711 RepID=UPI00142D57EE|nr:ATP-dependent DNA helicase PIF2-like [Brassica rapa]
MPRPDAYAYDSDVNTLISDELNYNHDEQREKHRELLAKITDEQRAVYQEILDAVNGDKGGMFFVYGFGGTGKTFLWNILGAAIRSLGEIILNVASSGIAALLLPGGRTAHSRFGIPINVHDFTTCTMTKGSDQAELVQQAKLIIWDEAPMMSRHCFETLDRSLRDIMGCNEPFGGKVVVFGGDFRQILPVVTDGGRVETVLASLNSSYLWNSCKVLRLTKNMRLMAGITDSEAKELEAFSKWILDIGDGNINQPNDGEVDIDIPEDLLITECENPIEAIVNEVYGTSFAEKRDPKFFKERAILSPRNQDVDSTNEYMLSQLSGSILVFKILNFVAKIKACNLIYTDLYCKQVKKKSISVLMV